MSRVSAFHSELGHKHHDNNQCQEGNKIEPRHRRSGTGNLPLCEVCEKLNKEGR
ncbi:MAG: hypothetical protein JWQ98_1648 [Chlorobi bacterium]|nr:hypothetical protein [Chlorobiota bacterium]